MVPGFGFDTTALTAYGLILHGLPPVIELMPAGLPASEPELTVRVESDRAAPAEHHLDEHLNVVRLVDGRTLALDRSRRTATFFGPALSPDLLAHPYLAPVASAFSRWAGREAFHAGAFVSGSRAWGVFGSRTAGKSTLLAALASRGIEVLSDDLVITDGRVIFPGPRCLDLREPRGFGDAGLYESRLGTRWRMPLPRLGVPVPVGGWLFLGWGPDLARRPVAAADLIGRLAAQRSCRGLPSDPVTLLALGTAPAWDLTRPQDWGGLDATVDLVLSTAAKVRLRPAGPAVRGRAA